MKLKLKACLAMMASYLSVSFVYISIMMPRGDLGVAQIMVFCATLGLSIMLLWYWRCGMKYNPVSIGVIGAAAAQLGWIISLIGIPYLLKWMKDF